MSSTQISEAEAQEILHRAQVSLSSLTKADMTELMSFKNPSNLVLKTMSGLVVLFDSNAKSSDWKEIRRVIGKDTNVLLANLIAYDRSRISDEQLARLKLILDEPDMVPEKIKASSTAVFSIFLWVEAMYKTAILQRQMNQSSQ